LFLKHKELLADYTIPKYFFDWFTFLPGFMRLIYPRIFIGPKGAVTPLHDDVWGTHAWLAELVGRKRWILFSPDQRELLYDYKVKPDKPDFERFPLFRKAKPLEATIGPGDIIFVPGGWPHYVISLDPTISLTHNFMGPGCFGPSLTSAVRERVLRRFTSISSAIEEQRS
jgi:ribosomal protein L16 Arg81 hydroxylase